ncbi:MFS transporter [Coxiella burnetii]|uniref:MFS transporter n=1 Tax=Coxiella burnetii TaxID=777 RepID=UPI000163A5D6|nr:MFS transporter [Coxiella burnetii]ATN85980.1 multidrug transporter [Coxiella burnetii str. Schperling]EDR35971.1 drug resistance MFS transporter, drug:H+ antiporter-1 (14 Spanner) (DHA2) family [Coxiella burnetii Q321]
MFKITEKNRKWWIFVAMSGALSVVFLDQTAISVILPPIQKDLGLSNVLLQWVINAYLLSLAALVIFGGKLGDVLGHKRTFLAGIIIFVLASISCAAAQTSYWLVTSRIIQGVGGAFMIPVTSVMMAHAFSESEQGKVMGLYVAVAPVFLSLGPLLSGLLAHYFNWRWVFWINVPISLLSIFLTIIAVPARENQRDTSKPLDWLGFLTFSLFIATLVVALMEGVNLGWSSKEIIFLFVVAAFSAIAFIFVERKAADPIVSLHLFTRKTFLSASLCLLFFTCAFSSSVFWAILLQKVMGYSPAATGLFYLPVTIPVMFMAPLGGMLRDKYGPRLPVMMGSTAVAAGSFWIALSAFKGHYSAMLPGFLLFGLGPALVYSAVMATTISSVPLSQMGMASGISNGIRQLGRVLGVAMIGSVISNIEHSRLIHSHLDTTGKLSQVSDQQLTHLLSNPAAAKHILSGLSLSEINHIHLALKSVFTFAFSMGMILAGFLLILTLGISFFLPNKPLRLLWDEKSKLV